MSYICKFKKRILLSTEMVYHALHRAKYFLIPKKSNCRKCAEWEEQTRNVRIIQVIYLFGSPQTREVTTAFTMRANYSHLCRNITCTMGRNEMDKYTSSVQDISFRFRFAKAAIGLKRGNGIDFKITIDHLRQCLEIESDPNCNRTSRAIMHWWMLIKELACANTRWTWSSSTHPAISLSFRAAQFCDLFKEFNRNGNPLVIKMWSQTKYSISMRRRCDVLSIWLIFAIQRKRYPLPKIHSRTKATCHDMNAVSAPFAKTRIKAICTNFVTIYCDLNSSNWTAS